MKTVWADEASSIEVHKEELEGKKKKTNITNQQTISKEQIIFHKTTTKLNNTIYFFVFLALFAAKTVEAKIAPSKEKAVSIIDSKRANHIGK